VTGTEEGSPPGIRTGQAIPMRTGIRGAERRKLEMKRIAIAGLAVLLAFTTVSFAGLEGRWLHVRVEEPGEDGEVLVNLPLSAVETILPTIEAEEFHGGRIILDDDELEGIDLRSMLEALKDTPDAEFVTVRSRDESVRVAKEHGLLVVLAEESDGEKVRVTIPLAVVQAMLGAGENELDLIAGLHALAEYDGGDLVTVQSEDTTVRVWIDSSETGN
jgi:hypothetical protein